MRRALLALIVASTASVAIATLAASPACAGAALASRPALAAPEGVITRVDYRGYRHYRSYGARYHRGPRAYGYYAPRAAYYPPRPAYYPPAVVYYPPPVVYYPQPVVYSAPVVAPRYYGAAAYYGDYTDW